VSVRGSESGLFGSALGRNRAVFVLATHADGSTHDAIAKPRKRAKRRLVSGGPGMRRRIRKRQIAFVRDGVEAEAPNPGSSE